MSSHPTPARSASVEQRRQSRYGFRAGHGIVISAGVTAVCNPLTA